MKEYDPFGSLMAQHCAIRQIDSDWIHTHTLTLTFALEIIRYHF